MAAETKLDSTVSTTNDNAPTLYTEHEEYRYDALGRRIWVRSIHGATCLTWYPNADCASALKREVWDGSALLYESRYPGDLNLPSATLEQETGGAGGSFAARFGRVAYLSGGDLDHPLDVIKMDGAASSATFAPRYNWRGLAEEPVCAAGQSCGTQYFGASSPSAYFELAPTPNGPAAWSGSLIEGQRDASGLLYKRNRYYDPASGRFTSQDPLGLGGGLNVYGFASGDPVNQDDPFGLCYHGEGKAAQANRTQSNVAACVDEPGLEDPGILDPVAIGTGLLAGPIDAAISSSVRRAAASGTVTFFRGVSVEEAADVVSLGGKLRAGAVARGNEGKYLTNGIEAATKWAAQNGSGSKVLQITVPADAVSTFEPLGRVDGIGEAWWAPIQSLKDAKVSVLNDLLTPAPK